MDDFSTPGQASRAPRTVDRSKRSRREPATPSVQRSLTSSGVVFPGARVSSRIWGRMGTQERERLQMARRSYREARSLSRGTTSADKGRTVKGAIPMLVICFSGTLPRRDSNSHLGVFTLQTELAA